MKGILSVFYLLLLQSCCYMPVVDCFPTELKLQTETVDPSNCMNNRNIETVQYVGRGFNAKSRSSLHLFIPFVESIELVEVAISNNDKGTYRSVFHKRADFVDDNFNIFVEEERIHIILEKSKVKRRSKFVLSYVSKIEESNSCKVELIVNEKSH